MSILVFPLVSRELSKKKKDTLSHLCSSLSDFIFRGKFLGKSCGAALLLIISSAVEISYGVDFLLSRNICLLLHLFLYAQCRGESLNGSTLKVILLRELLLL